jgi:hypothetical protein
MSVSYKRLWKLLIDRDIKKVNCVNWQVLVMLRLRKWEKVVALQQICLIKYVLH